MFKLSGDLIDGFFRTMLNIFSAILGIVLLWVVLNFIGVNKEYYSTITWVVVGIFTFALVAPLVLFVLESLDKQLDKWIQKLDAFNKKHASKKR